MTTYYVPESLAGQNLRDLSRQYGFRGDVLGNFAGVGEDTSLTAGQAFNLPSEYGPGSSEGGFASRYFTGSPAGSGVSPTAGGGGSNDIVEQAKKMRQFAIESNQPSIQTLQAGKQPLTDRYSALLDQIRGKERVATEREGSRLSQEYGRRGIPLSSDVFQQELGRRLGEVSEPYTTQSRLATSEGAGAQNQIDQAIAALQSGDPASALQGALTLQRLQQEAGQFGAQNALALQQFSLQQQEFGLRQEMARRPAEPQNPYMALGEGSTLFNLLTGKPIYKSPKTYKPGSNNNPAGI